ncbi:unnamed protein product (macronuclear) [Paramecium tetraurelia]|uniref:Uncharacterized protein n=1 Tax=Paramecium tetraurelia TaxID=5888 RepID=A0BP72_PARTE|nr:uncharacterized protein GSPATT00005088001 [Paramecium tetraurelia]CAK60339.1 unnamed protein product [Paramecium tetraurelia]|eukprot:XP_001427737.1 hypothetical protein (macronuclear) [Paramecium tetraurelia strain d4-2]
MSNQKESEIQKDIKQQLYQVPQEEELNADYEELMKAQNLNKQWQQMKQEAEYQEQVIQKRKLQKIEEEQKRLATKLEELINQPSFDEYEEKHKLIALKRRIEQDYKDEVDKLKEQFLLAKEFDVEKIVRKKIEMEKLIEAQKKKNEEYEKIQLELAAIREVAEKKDINSKKMLENALNRRGIPQQLISERDKVLLSNAILDDREEEQRQRDRIYEEVQQKVQQEKEKKKLETAEKLRDINSKKFELNEQQERILKEKAFHKELQKKGLDFLTQIELGNAPPLDILKKNIIMDEEKLDEYRLNYNLNNIAKKNKRFLQDGVKRIEQIREEQYNIEVQDRPYNGEIKQYLNTRNAESLFICRKIVDYIVDNSLRKILERENRMHMLKQQRKDYNQKGKNLKRTQNYLIDREFLEEEADKIFARVMRKVQREAANEIAVVNLLAQSVALNIIVNSVKYERNTTNPIDQIKKLYYDLRGENMEKNITDLKFNFKNKNEIQWNKVKKGKKNYNTDELLKIMREKKQLKQLDKEEDKKDVRQDEEIDESDINILDPEEFQCVPTLGLEKIKAYEIQYWEKISFVHQTFKNHYSNIKAGITHIVLSPFKDMLIIGMSNGEVALYDTTSGPAIISGIVPSFTKSKITDVQFGMDNVGHLLILDESGLIRVCYMGYNLKVNIPKEQLKGIESLPEGYQPMFYVQYFTLNNDFLARNKKQEEKRQILTYSIFHPSITFSCLQPTLMVGSNNGTIMKYNSNVDMFNGQNYKFPIHNILNTRIIVNEDEQFPNENFLNLQIQEEHEGKNPHVFREFFENHRQEIVYIGFLEEPEKILTIDKGGYVNLWEYDTGYYDLRKRSFRPKSKYKIQMTETQFTPDTTERKKYFPDENTDNEVQEGYQKYAELFNSPDEWIKLSEKPLKDGVNELIICYNELPQDGDTEIFEIIRVNHATKQMIEGYTQDYKATEINKYIYLEIIKPHIINPDIFQIEFLAINTQNFKLKKLRPFIEASTDRVEFDIVDNYYPFMVSYLFVHLPQGIYIISLATGTIVKQIIEHIQHVRVSFPQREYIPKGIQVIENEAMFFTYDNCNGCWKLQIQDDNDDNESMALYDNYRLEYEKLFLQ